MFKSRMHLNRLLILVFIFFTSSVKAQPGPEEDHLLRQLDSIRKHPGPASHFGELYYLTSLNVVDFFRDSPRPVKIFIAGFEVAFFKRFSDAADSFALHHSIPSAWKTYYSDTSLSPLQYHLLGINAHFNGDICQALVSSSSEREIRAFKKEYIRFGKCLSFIYNDFYSSALLNSKYRKLHQLSFGILKIYGRLLLSKWRKRQLGLALDYYRKPVRYNRKRALVASKMNYINSLILRRL